jgi:hypothetical protein
MVRPYPQNKLRSRSSRRVDSTSHDANFEKVHCYQSLEENGLIKPGLAHYLQPPIVFSLARRLFDDACRPTGMIETPPSDALAKPQASGSKIVQNVTPVSGLPLQYPARPAVDGHSS